ncbi:hypothetical protein ABPG75_008556 [Micractinium tetrahymenae]
MDRWVRRRRRPGFAQSLLGRLPDELLLHTLRLVPQRRRVALLGLKLWEEDEEGAVTLTTRGGTEGACRRLRQLALSVPCTAAIHVEKLGYPSAKAEAQLRRLLPHLQARTITDLRLHAGTEVPPTAVPALLAHTLFPGLRRLDLTPDPALCFTGFLALCSRLEALTLRLDEFIEPDLSLQDADLLACQLCGLPAPLSRMHISIDAHGRFANQADGSAPRERLLQLVAAHVPHASLGLSLSSWLPPSGSGLPWSLPRMQRLSIWLHTAERQEQFTVHLTSLTGVTQLELRAGTAHAGPAPTLGLDALPRLRHLQAHGDLPPEAWLCPHLTALRCLHINEVTSDGNISAPLVVACTGLRRLQFDWCRFAGPAFPGTLCSSLSLRLLDIVGIRLPPAACAALRPLRSLTALRLCDCNLDSLPLGGCIDRLGSLNVTMNPFDSPVSFEATAASRLRVLAIDFRPSATSGEGWEELRSRLLFFRHLEELHLINCLAWEHSRPVFDPAAEVLAAKLRTECGCEVLLDQPQSGYPEFGGLKWEDESL